MTTTRTAALALVLMTGTAFAAPAPQARDNAFQRFGKSFKSSVNYFKADLKARNEKAGPGFLKRTLTNMHAGVEKMQEKASTLGQRISIKLGTTKDAVAASLTAKREATVAGFTKLANATKTGLSAMKASHQEHVAQRKIDKAAAKDFRAWLNEKGNENAKTFYKGAAKDEALGTKRVLSVVNKVAVVDGALGSLVNPTFLVPTAAAVAGAKIADKMVKDSKRVMAERTVNQFMEKVPAERLELWSKGGVIDRELAK